MPVVSVNRFVNYIIYTYQKLLLNLKTMFQILFWMMFTIQSIAGFHYPVSYFLGITCLGIIEIYDNTEQ
jgi:hypothetical protein